MATPMVRLRQLGDAAEDGFPAETFVGGSREAQFVLRPNETVLLYYDRGADQWGATQCESYLAALGTLVFMVHYLELDELESAPMMFWNDVDGLPADGLAFFARAGRV